jgi:signal transduction histidine kinase
MGVRIMRERAKEIGATLNLETEPGQGTQVTVEWTEDEGRRTNDE